MGFYANAAVGGLLSVRAPNASSRFEPGSMDIDSTDSNIYYSPVGARVIQALLNCAAAQMVEDNDVYVRSCQAKSLCQYLVPRRTHLRSCNNDQSPRPWSWSSGSTLRNPSLVITTAAAPCFCGHRSRCNFPFLRTRNVSSTPSLRPIHAVQGPLAGESGPCSSPRAVPRLNFGATHAVKI